MTIGFYAQNKLYYLIYKYLAIIIQDVINKALNLKLGAIPDSH